MRAPGCSTWCCIGRPLPDAIERLSLHTDRIEIFADAAHDLLGDATLPKPKSLSFSVHAPTADINIASTREGVRRASIAILSQVCRRAAEIDASPVVVHPGLFPWPGQREESSAALLRSLDELADIQDETGVAVAIENMGGWEMCHFRDPSLLPELRERGLSFCLDVGHAHLNGVLADFLACGSPCAVHLHDNGGISDDHLPPGAGSIDFAALLPHLSPDIPWILEVPDISLVEPGLAFLREHGCRGRYLETEEEFFSKQYLKGKNQKNCSQSGRYNEK